MDCVLRTLALVAVRCKERSLPFFPSLLAYLQLSQHIFFSLVMCVRLALATLLSYSSLAEWSPQVPHKQDNCNLALLYMPPLHSEQEPLKYKTQHKNDLNCVHSDKL